MEGRKCEDGGSVREGRIDHDGGGEGEEGGGDERRV